MTSTALAHRDDDVPRLRHLIGTAALFPQRMPGMDQVTAIERGSRTKPDGTVEQYERVEYE